MFVDSQIVCTGRRSSFIVLEWTHPQSCVTWTCKPVGLVAACTFRFFLRKQRTVSYSVNLAYCTELVLSRLWGILVSKRLLYQECIRQPISCTIAEQIQLKKRFIRSFLFKPVCQKLYITMYKPTTINWVRLKNLSM